MLNINEVRLIGRLGVDPEIIKFGKYNEKGLLKLSVGTNDYQDNVSWHHVVVFGEKQIAFINEHAKKGSTVYVEGQITYRVKDNVKYTTICVSQYHNIILLDSKNQDTQNVPEDDDNDDDDIPF